MTNYKHTALTPAEREEAVRVMARELWNWETEGRSNQVLDVKWQLLRGDYEEKCRFALAAIESRGLVGGAWQPINEQSLQAVREALEQIASANRIHIDATLDPVVQWCAYLAKSALETFPTPPQQAQEAGE